MNILTNLFFWISTGLLVPVMVLLLLGFIYALCMIGGFYAIYSDRKKFGKSISDLIGETSGKAFSKMDYPRVIAQNASFLRALKYSQAHNWSFVYTAKALADFESEGEAKLEKSKTLMRLGPMLGLMGTLIPMGPALVGLATGDIATMAMNMQIAFSTTVIGVFLGGTGFVLYSLHRRWFTGDYYKLQFIIDLAQNEEK